MTLPRKWRKDGVKSVNGTSWRLMTGRDGDRESIGLGQVTEEEAERCLRAMQEEENETAGTELAGRMKRWADGPGGRAKVLRYLLGDEAPAFAPEIADKGAMRLDAYLADVWAPEREKTNPDTWAREKLLWHGHILPVLGGLRIRDLDHVRFDTFINEEVRKKSGEPLSWNTKRLIRAAYQACLTHAERKGHIPAMHKFYQLKDSGTVWADAQPLTSEQLLALVGAAKGPMYKALFGFSFESATRPSETARVRWEDIDWTRTDRAPFGRIAIRGTKTDKSERTIPLLNLSRELLDALWLADGQPTDGLIFAIDGEEIGSWKKALKTAARKAGITDRRIFPYLGRHTALTRVIDAGATAGEAAAFAGHTDARMVEEVYDHAEVSDRVNVHKFPRRTTG